LFKHIKPVRKQNEIADKKAGGIEFTTDCGYPIYLSRMERIVMALAGKITGALPAFRHRNYRLFWGGQCISLIGTHMQMVALGWFVLRVSNSSFYLGLVNALGMFPILLFSMFAGAIADRTSKRRLILLTQTAFLIQATALAFLASSRYAAVWNVAILAAIQGTIMSFDSPTRQSFVSEMVPGENVLSAVALNSGVFNAARIIGPAFAGFLIHYVGEAGCFYINAASFVAVIIAILMMRDNELFKAESRKHAAPMSEMKEGFRYVLSERRVLGLLVALVVTSIFGMPSMVLMPVFAKNVLHVGPKGLGFLMSAAGAGALAVMAVLAFSKRARRQGIRIILSGAVFAVSVVVFSQSRNYYFSMAMIAIAGAAITACAAMTNSSLQMLAPPHLRGRVMGIYIFVFMGMMPPGSLLMGILAQYLGAPIAVTIAGVTCLVMLAAISIVFPKILRIDELVGGAPKIMM
jgi:MFS family permease